VEPSLPADWPGFELTYRHGSTVYEIKATRHEDGSAALELDGEAVYFIPLDDTGRTHSVTVRLINPTVAEPMPVQNVRTPFAELLLTAPE